MPRLWVDSGFNVDVTIGTQGLFSLLTSGPAVSRFNQMTLLRTIIGMDLARTVHDSGEGSERCAIGVGVCSQEAFTGGTVADPLTDADFPTRGWIWRAGYRIFGFAADQPAIFTRRIDIDLRSMRKLENGLTFLAVDLTAIEGSNSTLRLLGLVRQLWLVG